MMKRFRPEQLRSEQGFTLLEMLIAVSLVVLIAVGLWGVLGTSIRAWAKGAQYIDANQRNRNALGMVRRQIASAYNAMIQPDPAAGGVPYPLFQGTESGFQFVSLNSLLFQDSPGLTLVTYEIHEGSSGAYSLVERESPYLGPPEDQQGFAAEDKITSILENLNSCLFEYYDPGNAENPAQWVSEWDGMEAGRLPAAVSMNMIWRDFRGNTVDHQLVIPIQASVAASTAVNIRGMIR